MTTRFTIFTIFMICCFSLGTQAQVTITSKTLPDYGDELNYRLFTDYQDSVTYKNDGENLTWSYDDFFALGSVSESYLDISGTALADSFPNADMFVDANGFQAAASRKNNSIELVGLDLQNFDQLVDLEIEATAELSSPFILRQTPMTYLDSYDDDFDFSLTLPGDLIPGLDSIELPIPGATLAAIRINVNIYKKEEATAYGTLNILGETLEVLKITQLDSTRTQIEVGFEAFGTVVWFNFTDILAGGLPGVGNIGGLNQSTTTYKFVSPDHKASIVEFSEDKVLDTLGNLLEVNVRGRVNAEFLALPNQNQIDRRALTIYPNPSKGEFAVEGLTEDIKRVLIYDANGEKISELGNLGRSHTLNLTTLKSGTYFVKMMTNFDVFTETIIIH